MTTKAFLCLGSNINPKRHIRFAVQRLQQDFDGVVTSNVYKSSAVGFEGDDFLNMAIMLKTDFSLGELLRYTDTLEKEAGRIRVARGNYDSRTLDVDVVMFGDLTGEHKGRQWPSEDIHENAHVLLPMSEIAGDRDHPALGVNFARLWKEFDSAGQWIKQVEKTW